MRRHSSFALGFIGLIVLGFVLLSMPWARTAGGWGLSVDTLFTATSAVCVTGLTTLDIGAEFSFAGQLVLLVLVQLGCLGLMTCGTFLLVAIGRRLSLSREFSLMNAYGVAGVQGLRSLVFWMIGSTLLIESLGAIVLYYQFGEIYPSIFFSVMSFCNAGFSLYPDSIARFANNPVVVLVMATETILGGIGFLVIYNLCTFRFLRKLSGARGRLSLHTNVVLRFSFYLLAAMFVAFLFLEWNGVLARFGSSGEKLLVSFYQAVTPRTCGFSLVPTEALKPITRLLCEIMMFCGGAPGSAAAGIKVTTLAVLVYTIVALCRGDSETIISCRVVPVDIVRESLVIITAMIIFVVAVLGALMITEADSAFASDALFFEAVSAVTTTGLSIGELTARLSFGGKVVIMVAMFIGRLGALTVVMMIGDRESQRRVRYPNEELVVG